MDKVRLIRITTIPVSLRILLRGQLRYMNQYFEVVGISSSGEYLAELQKDEGIRTLAVNLTRNISPLRDLLALIKLIKIFHYEKPLIVHTHTPKAGTLGMIAAWLCKVPVRMHTVAGLPLLEVRGLKRKLLNVVEIITYRCATKVYPNSFGLLAHILHNRFADANKLKVIGNGSSNGIDAKYFSLEQINRTEVLRIRDTYSINHRDFVFIFIGRLVKDKGINELISAFVMLNKIHKNSKLMLVGLFEQELDPLNESIINTIKSHPNIIFARFQKDVRPFLAASHVLVFPSYREGMPNVPMQACAMKLPCIVSNINGCNEIIVHEYNGLIVPAKSILDLHNAMEKIIVDRDLYHILASNARESVLSRYDQSLVWRGIKEEYDNQINLAGYS